MLRTFSSLPKQRRAATGLLLSLSLIVPLAACSQPSDQQTASPGSSASACADSEEVAVSEEGAEEALDALEAEDDELAEAELPGLAVC